MAEGNQGCQGGDKCRCWLSSLTGKANLQNLRPEPGLEMGGTADLNGFEVLGEERILEGVGTFELRAQGDVVPQYVGGNI